MMNRAVGRSATLPIGTDTLSPSSFDLVIGADASWSQLQPHLVNAKRVMTPDWKSMTYASEESGRHIDLIDVTGDIAVIEDRAWSWTLSLIQTILREVPAASADALAGSRRLFYWSVFLPLSISREQASRIRRLSSTETILPVGVESLLAIELSPRMGPVPSRRPVRTLTQFSVSLVKSMLRRARSLIPEVTRNDRTNPTPVPDVGKRARKQVLALAAADVHLNLFEPPILDLRERGWSAQLLSFHPSWSPEDRAASMGLTLVDPGGPATSTPGVTLPGIDVALRCWAETNLGARHVDWLAAQIPDLLSTGAAAVNNYMRILSKEKPDAVLTISELMPATEAMAVACRRLDIPTIHVQHGSITARPCFKGLEFDAFCLFGEAYAEVLTDLGSDPASLYVTGNPVFDSKKESISESAVSKGPSPANSNCFSLLFAGGYAYPMVSDASLYDSLSWVLDAAERDGDIDVIVKLHPIGAGSETGYEKALAEHPNAKVSVTRDGDLDDMMRRCDAVITTGSTVAIDAARHHKPTILLTRDGERDLIPLVIEGTAFRAGSADEVLGYVNMLRSRDSIPQETYKRVADRYSLSASGTAGSRIADIVETLAQRFALQRGIRS